MGHSSLIWATALRLAAVRRTADLRAPIIVASGLYIAWRRHRLHRDRAATIEMLR
jgi:hypothetical protein